MRRVWRAGHRIGHREVLVRSLLLSVLLVLVATAATALPVSEASARRVAQNLFRQHIALHGSWGGSLAPAIVAVTPVKRSGDRVAFNVVVAPSGHVLVGGDDELSAVLLYSDVSALDLSRVSDPQSLEGWIVPEVASQLVRLRNLARKRPAGTRPPEWEATRTGRDWRHFDVAEGEFRPRGRRLRGEAGLDEPVGEASGLAESASSAGPLLTTNWSQGPPYNNDTPADTGCAHTVAGCVTIAVVQLMKVLAVAVHGHGQPQLSLALARHALGGLRAPLRLVADAEQPDHQFAGGPDSRRWPGWFPTSPSRAR